MTAGEQHVQNHAERVDVGRRRDRIAAHLFRRGELRREGTRALDRDARIVVEQLGDAEVEQLHVAVARDENVRRLEVAMDDEIRVRAGHRVEHAEKETDALFRRQHVLRRVRVEALSVDVLEHEIRLPAAAHARVEQACDAGMREAREQRALATKARLTRGAERGRG